MTTCKRCVTGAVATDADGARVCMMCGWEGYDDVTLTRGGVRSDFAPDPAGVDFRTPSQLPQIERIANHPLAPRGMKKALRTNQRAGARRAGVKEGTFREWFRAMREQPLPFGKPAIPLCHVRRGESVGDVAARFSVSAGTVYRWLKTARERGAIVPISTQRWHDWDERERIVAAARSSGLSVKRAALKLGVSPTSLARWMKAIPADDDLGYAAD